MLSYSLRPRSTHHRNIWVLQHQLSKHGHLLLQVMFPDLSYPALGQLGAGRMVPHYRMTLLLGVLLVLEGCAMKTHPGCLAGKARVGANAETCGGGRVHASSQAQHIAVSREGWYLGVRVEVGWGAELWWVVSGMALGQTSELVLIGSDVIWPALEPRQLRRHGDVAPSVVGPESPVGEIESAVSAVEGTMN